ncbi:MAG TPA: histidine--tRNA ligase [Candidatus Saccharimonadales bacterium]|nr:histidine--tRNA ligase [Candidatus Saccharimonadales bacterium]
MSETPPETVEARKVKGFRDILPHQVLARRRMISTFRAVFERYGFVPLDTPAVEYLDALLGLGEEGTKKLFRMQSPEGDEIALRYDLTVPLARFVSESPELPRPLRRYQVAPVWRADKPDPGRYREFIQFDIDTVGASSPHADAEILAAMDEALRELGVSYRIRFSSRKILDSLMRWAGVPAGKAAGTLRILDKLDKQGLDAVCLELGPGRTDASGDRIPGLGLGAEPVEAITRFLDLPREIQPSPVVAVPRGALLDSVEKLFSGVEGAAEGIGELRLMDGWLAASGIDESRVEVDLSIARGLDYYTGPVFEAILTEAPELGAIFGGGRYDGLVERFLGVKVPATGASIGVDRLLAGMERLGLVAGEGWSTASVLVTVMDRERMADYIALTKELREDGIAAEIYLGDAKSLKKQFAYADRVGIPVVVIAGSNEFAAGTVSIKDLTEGKKREGEAATREEWVGKRFGQQTVPRAGMAKVVRSLLERP